MIVQMPGWQLISLMAQLTDEREHAKDAKLVHSTPQRVCQCDDGDHFAEMTDLRRRFVPPRLDL